MGDFADVQGTTGDTDTGDGVEETGDAWWSWGSLASAPGLALCGFVFAVLSIFGLSPAHELTSVIVYSLHSTSSAVHVFWVDGLIQVVVAALGGWMCATVLRETYDDEPAWAGSVARAGLLVAVLSVVLNLTTVIAVLSVNDPHAVRF